jgi:hypothetical protein
VPHVPARPAGLCGAGTTLGGDQLSGIIRESGRDAIAPSQTRHVGRRRLIISTNCYQPFTRYLQPQGAGITARIIGQVPPCFLRAISAIKRASKDMNASIKVHKLVASRIGAQHTPIIPKRQLPLIRHSTGL